MAQPQTNRSTTTRKPDAAEASLQPLAWLEPWQALQAQFLQQWSESTGLAADGRGSTPDWMQLWTRQAESFGAALQQAAQQQQAMLASWQQLQAELVEQWRQQAEQVLGAMSRLQGPNDSR
jgi:hypothetical protein